MSKIKVGIIGAAGYTAGELIRILIHHPHIEISYIQSDSSSGKPIGSVHQDLFYVEGLNFTNSVADDVDVIFLCKGHGESVNSLNLLDIDMNTKIIDLSQDFRLSNSHPEIFEKYGPFIYGLPELNKSSIVNAKNIANPGCFATCIQLGLLPIAANKILNSDVQISAITGSTGAGQKLSVTSHFSWRNNNISVYKPFQHQHLKEIKQSLVQLDPAFSHDLNFIPYRGNFTRGIIASMYLKTSTSLIEAADMYNDYYSSSPFVKISTDNVNLKQVVNTNYCQLHLEKSGDYLLIVSTIDNLIKGASGQAVQNMNLLFGFEESEGLNLKGIAF